MKPVAVSVAVKSLSLQFVGLFGGTEIVLASGNAGAPGGIRTPNLLIRSS